MAIRLNERRPKGNYSVFDIRLNQSGDCEVLRLREYPEKSEVLQTAPLYEPQNLSVTAELYSGQKNIYDQSPNSPCVNEDTVTVPFAVVCRQ